jgi:hypothetical protein
LKENTKGIIRFVLTKLGLIGHLASVAFAAVWSYKRPWDVYTDCRDSSGGNMLRSTLVVMLVTLLLGACGKKEEAAAPAPAAAPAAAPASAESAIPGTSPKAIEDTPDTDVKEKENQKPKP